MNLLLLLACSDPRVEGTEVGDCTDGADNDGDGAFDCADDGCTNSPDCTNTDTADTSDTGETVTDPPEGFSLGDPISAVSSSADVHAGYEWTDAAILDDGSTALLAGVSGYAIYDIDSGEILEDFWESRTYRLDVHNGMAIVAGRSEPPLLIDVSDPRSPGEPLRGSGDLRDGTSYDGVAIYDGLVAIAWQESGLRLFNLEFQEQGVFAGDHVYAVELFQERALITDRDQLILLDVSNPAAPTELTRTTLPGEGRDVAVSGEHVAVGLGGLGVMVYTLSDDTLTARDQLTLPGTAMGVDIDGDYLWIAAWEQVALAWLGEGGPVILGHEEPVQSAFGVGAGSGRAVVGDWAAVSAMAVNEGVGGPELVMPSQLWFTEGGGAQQIRISNNGAFDLSLTLEPPTRGFSIDTTEISLAPGQSHTLTVTPPSSSDDGSGAIAFASNDPDETVGVVVLSWSDLGVGSEHPDFTLQGFDLPDTSLTSYSLADYAGQAVYLVYWAVY